MGKLNLSENAAKELPSMPSGAVMEIACEFCNWDCGYESDLVYLFDAYKKHIDNCPRLETFS